MELPIMCSLNCSFCGQPYCPSSADHRPRVLSRCNHSICTQCYRLFLLNSFDFTIPCPVCGLKTSIGKKEHDLPVDNLFQRVLEEKARLEKVLLDHENELSLDLSFNAEEIRARSDQRFATNFDTYLIQMGLTILYPIHSELAEGKREQLEYFFRDKARDLKSASHSPQDYLSAFAEMLSVMRQVKYERMARRRIIYSVALPREWERLTCSEWADEKRIHQIRKGLSLMLHAQHCTGQRGAWFCPVKNCIFGRALHQHIPICEALDKCTVINCVQYRQILGHYEDCASKSTCPICRPPLEAKERRMAKYGAASS